MKTKKFLSIILAVIMIFSFVNVVFAADTEGNIIILYTNDVHCAIDDYAILAAYRAEKIEEGNTVITVDAGDAIQGEVIGALTQGEVIVDIMNTVGYDYAVPGNHEYDYGMETFLDIAENKAQYEYISSNFCNLTSNEYVFEPYAIKDVNGVQIAFVGITTPETITKSTPEFFKDENGNFIYGFPVYPGGMTNEDLYENVQQSVDEAIADGADIVVAIGHTGILETSDGWKSTDVIANTDGIDYYIDAHSHETIESASYKNANNEDVIITSTGTKFANFGVLTISENDADFKLINPDDVEVETMSEEAQIAYENIKTKIDDYNEQIAYLYEVIGTSEAKLVAYDSDRSWAVRKRETNAGDFVADAYRTVTGADVAIANGGGIRAEIEVGSVSRKNLMDVNAFNNDMCVLEVTGQQLVDVLEHGARSCPESLGGFFQVSGVTFEIHTYLNSPVITDQLGNFIGIDETMERRVRNVLVNGEPVDLEKTYTLAGSAYVLTQGGDGLTMLEGVNVVEQEGLHCDSEMLIKYFTENLGGKITFEQYGNPDGDGRIRINTACEHNFERTKSEENLTRPENGNDGYYTYTCANGCGETEIEYVKRADYTEYSAAHERFGETINKYDFNETAIDYATEKHAEMLEEYLGGSWLKNNYIESEQYILDGLADGFNELCDDLIAGAEDGTFLNADYTEIDKEITALEEWDVDGDYKEIIDNIKAELEELKADDTSTQADVYELLARIEAIRNCEHICHSGNWFLKILWSIANFFCWLFKIVPTCACGMTHY
ncbi:MAG: bifunctional metallophosphatase/5'-nucleotidase [Clostridia bacterium]|nr:bifunctional metallophosphatase/5'-nucleotidase [Clostridia bacterium]